MFVLSMSHTLQVINRAGQGRLLRLCAGDEGLPYAGRQHGGGDEAFQGGGWSLLKHDLISAPRSFVVESTPESDAWSKTAILRRRHDSHGCSPQYHRLT